MKKLIWIAAAALLFAAPASAQWQTPDHSIPVGRGSGVGFKFATPGIAGTVLTSNGASSDPTFQAPGGAVSSVSNSDGTLTISPTTGAVVASLALTHANAWTGIQTFNGAYTGLGAVAAPGTPAAGVLRTWGDSTTKTLRAINDAGTLSTTVIADTGAANNFLTAISAGGVISKARPTCANLSDAGTGCTSTAPTPAALTKADDTNVTLTLGGTPATALLQATSITAGWTGQLSVARGGTGIASGTSGGIPYYSGSTTIASSAALAANALVIGGGAGVAPSTTTTGTGVLTALGVNVGSAGAFVVNGGVLGTPTSGTLTNATGLPISTGLTGAGTGVLTALGVNVGTAGAFVVNGGALGTPTSGTVTNLTGTASININGTVGATTRNTGAFTTLSVGTGSLNSYIVRLLGGNANTLAVDNDGSQYTSLDYASNGTIKALTYYDNVGSAFVFRNFNGGTGGEIQFDTGTSTKFAITASGQLRSRNSTPTVGTCGTSPSVSGTDVVGTITTGSTATTACTLTFSSTWPAAPKCTLTARGAANAGLFLASTSTTTAVLNYTSATSATFDYHCIAGA